eukprot:6196043-Pleurochrysis_carterae.AAC.1
MSEAAVPLDPDATAICGACKKPMLEADGVTPRKVSGRFGHDCSHCKCTLHAPLMCEDVWFPVVSSNAREFCCLEHLKAYNAECPSYRIVPVRRREHEPLIEDGEGSQEERTGRLGEKEVAEGDIGGEGEGDGKEDEGNGSEQPKPVNKDGNGSGGGTGAEGRGEGDESGNLEDEAAKVDKEQEDGASPEPPAEPNPGERNSAEKNDEDLSTEAIPEGNRIKCCFGVDSPEWFGGLSGPISETGQTFGFDDGEVRFVPFTDLRDLKQKGLFLPFEEGAPYGLVAGTKVKHRAEAFTLFKEGRMREARCAGVLVGYQEHALGPTPIYAAHHAAGNRAAPDEDDCSRQSRRSTRGGSGGAERKWLHTFRCDDVVRCLAAEGNNATATVLGVCNAHLDRQMRRVL